MSYVRRYDEPHEHNEQPSVFALLGSGSLAAEVHLALHLIEVLLLLVTQSVCRYGLKQGLVQGDGDIREETCGFLSPRDLPVIESEGLENAAVSVVFQGEPVVGNVLTCFRFPRDSISHNVICRLEMPRRLLPEQTCKIIIKRHLHLENYS